VLERADGRLAVHEAQAQAPDALPRVRVLGAARGGAVGRLGGEVDRAHVLVDARREAMRSGRSPSTRAQSRTARPAALSSPACQKASVMRRRTAGLLGSASRA
jgi:hypothetical protein